MMDEPPLPPHPFTCWSSFNGNTNLFPHLIQSHANLPFIRPPLQFHSFHPPSLMGNYISHRRTCAVTGKIILTDGTVHEFDHPPTVAELMLDHPQEFMVELRSVVGGRRPAPLPADLILETDKIYLMIPMKRGKSAAFSAHEARRIMDWARWALHRRSSSAQRGMLSKLMAAAEKCNEKGEKHKVSIKEELEGEEEEGEGQELLQDYFRERQESWSRQLSGKGWKPALDTIKEKGTEKKLPHWLFRITLDC